jgi:hypothetical protein
MKVVSLSALRTDRLYPPGNIPGTHFCQMLSQTQGQTFLSPFFLYSLSFLLSIHSSLPFFVLIFLFYFSFDFTNFFPFYALFVPSFLLILLL